MDRKKIIYIGSILLVTVFASVTYFSYAFFTSKNEYHGRVNMVVGTLDYKIKSDDLDNNQITLAPNSIKKITIKLTSLNKIDSKYELFYETTNNEVEVGYTGENSSTGTINAKSSKEIEVFISNNSSTSATITFSCEGGFTHNTLVKSKGISIPSQTSICDNYTTHVWNYDYTGDVQEFISPCNGTYTMETWGAQGGGSTDYSGAKGGYVKGDINLNEDDKLYVYVGEHGDFIEGRNGGDSAYVLTNKIYDNGAQTRFNYYNAEKRGYGYAGGGATDIRLVSNNWNNFDSLKSRIMVASGGGGANTYWEVLAADGAGGGLIGYNGSSNSTSHYSTGGTQVDGGNYNGNKNGFGIVSHVTGTANGGSGYYTGGPGAHSSGVVGTGGGGSSFISGHNGCVAIKEESTENNIIQRLDSNNETCTDGTTDITCSYHYSDYKFTNTMMIDGAGYRWENAKKDYTSQPQPNGTYSDGHTGNGYARITYYGNDRTKVTYDYNYLPNDIFEETYNVNAFNPCCVSGVSAIATGTTTDSYGKTYYQTARNGWYFSAYTSNPLILNKIYTFTFEAKASTNLNARIGTEQGSVSTSSIGTNWQKYNYTIKVTSNNSYSAFIFYNWQSADEDRTLYVRNVQLQEGNLYTKEMLYEPNSTLNNLETPRRDGWTFVGWFTDPIGGTQVTSSTTVPNTDTTYYAHWTKNIE